MKDGFFFQGRVNAVGEKVYQQMEQWRLIVVYIGNAMRALKIRAFTVTMRNDAVQYQQQVCKEHGNVNELLHHFEDTYNPVTMHGRLNKFNNGNNCYPDFVEVRQFFMMK